MHNPHNHPYLLGYSRFALGANSALESSAVLLNQIYLMNKSLTLGEKLPKKISAMFDRDPEKRKPQMQAAFDAFAFITRLHACDGNLIHFIMRCVFSIQRQAAYVDKLAELCCEAPRIHFLPVKYRSKPATFP